MEQHLAVLLDRARRTDTGGDLSLDDRYVWWGKVRSQHRLQRAPHQADIEAIEQELAADIDDAGEVQLYLTDYRSLYVADVAEIVTGDLDPTEGPAAPAYYARRNLACDYWFKVADIRLLVADDLPGVGAELRHLRNVHYHDKPVSLYGGMVDLPLVVTRPDGRRFFDPEERDAITDGRLWAQWDVEQGGGVAAMERELRDNVVGDRAWMALVPTARRFIATGEKLFREHRTDPAFDFGPVIGAFAKGLEVQCRAVLRVALSRLPPRLRQVNIEGRTLDLLDQSRLSLGQLARILATEEALARALTPILADRGFFAGQLPPILAAFSELRNPAIHEKRVPRAAAQEWRDRLLGVGSEGVFARLGGP